MADEEALFGERPGTDDGREELVLLHSGQQRRRSAGAAGHLQRRIYKTAEFCGETIDKMGVEGRATMCNMAIEMGGETFS